MDLHNNNITRIEKGTFENVVQVSLYNNPLQCNCSLVWLKEWLHDHHEEQTTCTLGCVSWTYKNKPRWDLQPPSLECNNITCEHGESRILVSSLDTLDCTPENENTQSHLNKFVLAGLGFLLVVIFGAMFLIFKKRHILKIMIDREMAAFRGKFYRNTEDDQRNYDVFITHSIHDVEFVLHKLIPNIPCLQECYPGTNVIVQERDFPPGRTQSDTIIEAINGSKKILVILSSNFVANEWCMYAFKNAHKLAGTDRVVVVLLGDKPEARLMDKLTKHYLNARFHVKYTPENEEGFYRKLANMITTPVAGHQVGDIALNDQYDRRDVTH